MIDEGERDLVGGMNLMDLKRGMQPALQQLVAELSGSPGPAPC